MASASAPSWTVASLLRVSAEYLADKGSSSPRLDAELLLAEALQLERIQLIIQAERPLSGEEVTRYRELIARRARREPIAYILGRAAFRYLELEVGPGVLIPRPETEELVEAALEELRVRPPLAPVPSGGGWAGPVVADLGTGSGAIAFSLATEGGVRVLATDSSGEALGVARRNRARMGLAGAVELVSADLLGEFASGTLRLLVSNPPYIPTHEYEALEPDVRDYEPRAALDAGADGLEVYRRLAPQALSALGPGGVLLVEVGHDQAERVAEVLRGAGLSEVASQRDLSGRERIVRAVRPGTAVRDSRELTPWEAAAVAGALRQGAVVGVPTDTVYGLAAAWDSSPGVERLFAATGLSGGRPLAANK
ncbi:MAG TPA: peptide chain release factor N(5)-glutamine methyltransferase, partial [Thermoleophilia bacterium]|nr:peptide chain release factor N(5)-glutamine methyltransferase [Thermoleophilia bacterium]